jgi:hypothetical protein
MATSAEHLHQVLVRALAILRSGDEIEARRLVSAALSAHEQADCHDASADPAARHGRPGTGGGGSA